MLAAVSRHLVDFLIKLRKCHLAIDTALQNFCKCCLVNTKLRRIKLNILESELHIRNTRIRRTDIILNLSRSLRQLFVDILARL